MSSIVVIIFPYKGYEIGKPIEHLFWRLVDFTIGIMKRSPIVILNKDTERKGQAKAFLDDPRSDRVEIHRTWAVDTCQMWLSGWGFVIDEYPEISRLIQLPGDMIEIQNQTDFFRNLKGFLTWGDQWDLVIGDFTIPDPFAGKYLIDNYGTYPLLANWFPDLSQRMLKDRISRPRSEFLNINVEVLKELLLKRKFAYEQTLNMLIQSWDFGNKEWQYKIYPHHLGDMEDDSSYRQFSGCINQIERTERMLKVLYRQVHEPKAISQYPDYLDQFNRLDRVSTSIRQTAVVTIRSLLDLHSQPGA